MMNSTTINNSNNSNNPNNPATPVSSIPVQSSATLIKASLLASVIAAVLLVTAILPAEYNIDPTGVGKALGLTQLAVHAQTASASLTVPAPSASSMTQAPETALIAAAALPLEVADIVGIDPAANMADAPSVAEIAAARSSEAVRSDTVTITIGAGSGLEYKLLMDKFVHLEYEWSTGGEALYFDFHGEPKGDTTGYFESFALTTSAKMKGSLTTPFAGSHGWYWENSSDQPIIVTLTTKGAYSIKG